MGTPARQNILDDLQTTFEGITIANGYKSTVVTVEPVIRDWGDPECNADNRPWIGFMPENQTFEHYAFGQLRVTLPIIIIAHINASTKALALIALDNLDDDLIAATMADQTRNSNATMTTLVSSRDDTGDPDVIHGRDAVSGTLEMKLNIIYHRDIGSS